jgi:hypothetical protein
VERNQLVKQVEPLLAAVGVIDVVDEQRADEAVTELAWLGVSGEVRVDFSRQCVLSHWLPVGNVREESLADILAGSRMAETRGDRAGSSATDIRRSAATGRTRRQHLVRRLRRNRTRRCGEHGDCSCPIVAATALPPRQP